MVGTQKNVPEGKAKTSGTIQSLRRTEGTGDMGMVEMPGYHAEHSILCVFNAGLGSEHLAGFMECAAGVVVATERTPLKLPSLPAMIDFTLSKGGGCHWPCCAWRV